MRAVGLVLGAAGALLGLGLQLRLWITDWGVVTGAPGGLPAALLVMAVAATIVGLGVAGAILAARGRRRAGWLMVISGLIGFPLLPGYQIAGPLLIAGGIMCILVKPKSKQVSAQT